MLSVKLCEAKSKAFKKNAKANDWILCKLNVEFSSLGLAYLIVSPSNEETEYTSTEQQPVSSISSSIRFSLKSFKSCELKTLKERSSNGDRRPAAVLIPANRLMGHVVHFRMHPGCSDDQILVLQRQLDEFIHNSRSYRRHSLAEGITNNRAQPNSMNTSTIVEPSSKAHAAEETAHETMHSVANRSLSAQFIDDGTYEEGEDLCASTADVWEDNELYEMCDENFCFRVTVRETEDSNRLSLSGDYILYFDREHIELLSTEKKFLHKWQFQYVRRIGGTEAIFKFNAGHRSFSGPGLFIFVAVDAATGAQMHRVIRERMDVYLQQHQRSTPTPLSTSLPLSIALPDSSVKSLEDDTYDEAEIITSNTDSLAATQSKPPPPRLTVVDRSVKMRHTVVSAGSKYAVVDTYATIGRCTSRSSRHGIGGSNFSMSTPPIPPPVPPKRNLSAENLRVLVNGECTVEKPANHKVLSM